MTRKPYTQGRSWIGRLPAGVDLVESVTRIANEEGIKVGTVSLHGTLARLTLTVLNRETRFAETIVRDEGGEIAAAGGTISQFKGRSLAKLNGAFALIDGSLVGGTVVVGTVTHACEIVITELEGGVLTRDFDMETGLPLWKASALLIDR